MRKPAWRMLVPLLVAAGIAALPCPAGLARAAWLYFALFAGVIAAVIAEPVPAAVAGLLGVSLAVACGFPSRDPALATQWLLGGFADATVWLIFGAFMFALGFERTGLGRRLALVLVRRLGGSALGLGYAIVLADLLLAPFIPSNAARSGGIVFSVVRSIPPLYGSEPGPTARRLGSYLVATAFAASAITSAMFLTALAPNLLAVALVRKTAGLTIGWREWFVGFAPAGLLLLAVTPALLYRLYPPDIRRSAEVPAWAAGELARLGPFTRREGVMAALAMLAIALWILGGAMLTPTEVVIGVVALSVVAGAVSWDDVLGHRAAWNILIWFATLVTLAEGLTRVGFVPWLAAGVSGAARALPATVAMAALVAAFFVLHYAFASITAHVGALLPVTLAAAMAVPGLPLRPLALLLCYALGLMGVLTPYASGPAPLYYGSGFIPPRTFWLLGAGLGLLFLGALLGLALPFVSLVSRGP